MSQATGETEQKTDSPGRVREIGHNEFDPIGTMALMILYFLILVFLWFVMYFIEFLGNDPTVVGTVVGIV